ncbi:DNA-3-methyladenine glycosylase I [Amphibacillus sp. Q70]|uniref:DNA-3-methyladenine glycosylase I n=1 Tax=Amphibacillus sp. Q70 TaxID=3453416 RepID=UPI003F852B84
MNRCTWVTQEPLYIAYHDHEWGKPDYHDHYLFEMLCLEGAQAGLSWWTILQKRENYRKAFDHFDPEKIVNYDQEKVKQLLGNSGIVRNKLKINSVISNAQAYLKIVESGQSFSNYIWQFVNGQPIINYWKNEQQVPVSTEISEKMSKQLKKDGFKFVGPTICYAYMQAVGMVNDHTTDCFCHPNHSK